MKYCFLLLLTTIAHATPTFTEDAYDASLYNWSRVLSEACHVVKDKYYVKNIDPQAALIESIKAFVALDPHSTFLDPKSYKEIIESTSGEFFGIGVVIAHKHPDDEFLMVVDVISKGPADTAGVKTGDKIIGIDEHILRGISTDEATARLKGARHSCVLVRIMRDGYPEPITLTITRDIIKDQNSICYQFADQNVLYMHLNMFTQTACTQLENLLSKAQKKKYRGIILDLRNNSGGLLNAAVDIAGLFLEKGSLIVSTKDRNGKLLEQYKTTKKPIYTTNTPIFVLINNFTASAAEILAGCLQIYAEQKKSMPIFVVGTKSFGKGSVQEIIPVGNDCAIKLTTALYFMPNDKTIQGIGVIPDIESERMFPPSEHVKWFNETYGSEKALKNSIQAEVKPKPKEKSAKEKKKESIATDSQVRDTLSCINILHYNNQWRNRSQAIETIKNILVCKEPQNLHEIKQ